MAQKLDINHWLGNEVTWLFHLKEKKKYMKKKKCLSVSMSCLQLAGTMKQPSNSADLTHSKILCKERNPCLGKKTLSSHTCQWHGERWHSMTENIFQLFLGALPSWSQSDAAADSVCFRSQATGPLMLEPGDHESTANLISSSARPKNQRTMHLAPEKLQALSLI